MANKKIDIKALANQAAKLSNHNETKASTDFPLPPAGKTVGRFVEYIELGVQKKVYAGKTTFVPKVRLAFELLHPKNVREVEIDGVKTKRADRITPTPYTLSLHEKAGFYKLYDSMKYKREDIAHMSQMLGEAFVFDIEHNTVPGANNKPGKTYANIKAISAPQVEDALAGTVKKLAVPPAMSELKIFLFDNPTQETWDSLFIDGTKEVKDAKGVVTQKSKNWIQEMILGANNFGGSALEQLLGGAGDLPEFADAEQEAEEEVTEDADAELDQLEVVEEEVEEAPAPVAKAVTKKPLSVVKTTAAPAKQVTAKSAPAKTGKPVSSVKTASPSKAPAKAVVTKKVASAGGKTATQEAIDDLGLFEE